MRKESLDLLIKFKIFQDNTDIQDFVALDSVLETFGWADECGDEIFKHLIGSYMIGCNDSNSDIDFYSVHQSNIIVPNLEVTKFSPIFTHFGHDQFVEYTSFSMLDNLNNLINSEHFVNPTDTGKIFNHLYALKYNLIEDIQDKEIFDFYKKFLLAPGLATSFWEKTRRLYADFVFSLPDRDCDWTIDTDNSESKNKKKEVWNNLDNSSEAMVDEDLGYDLCHAKKCIQNMMIATCVLSQNNEQITENQKDFLFRMKNRNVDFVEYKEVLESVWNIFQNYSCAYHRYFLGYGYDIQTALEHKVFGNRGLMNIFLKSIKIQKNWT